MHTHRMRDIFTCIHTLRRYVHTLRGGGAEDVWRQEVRCIDADSRGEGDVCVGHTVYRRVESSGQSIVYREPRCMRCIYGVSRAEVCVCARHTVYRRMHVLGILCTDVLRGEVYLWCIERLSVCMCSAYCLPTRAQVHQELRSIYVLVLLYAASYY
jgi:hypothetical protein